MPTDQFKSDKLPPHSHLWTYHSDGDFLDCYSCTSNLPPQEACAAGVDHARLG